MEMAKELDSVFGTGTELQDKLKGTDFDVSGLLTYEADRYLKADEGMSREDIARKIERAFYRCRGK
jgi:hypothetical protein